jgi:cyclase
VIQKRLVGVITVRQGWAVQSFGYQRHLPLGRPEVLAENLDRWGVDEILLQCTDRSRNNLGPDLALLERITKKGLSTPLTYQGGIRNVADGVAAVQAGAERIALDSLLRDDPHEVAALAEPLGAQALIAALPLSHGPHGKPGLEWLDHRNGRSRPIPVEVSAVLKSGAISELLLVDWQHEGQAGGFDETLLDAAGLPALPVIAFGGLSDAEQLRRVLGRPQVVAAGVGHFLSWREHAVQQLKEALRGLPLRPATYAGACWV